MSGVDERLHHSYIPRYATYQRRFGWMEPHASVHRPISPVIQVRSTQSPVYYVKSLSSTEERFWYWLDSCCGIGLMKEGKQLLTRHISYELA